MNCREAQEQMHGYLDGELELTRSLEIERHMNECRVCASVYKGQTALRSALRGGAPYYEAPPKLRKRLRSSLGDAAKAEAPMRFASRRWLAVGASLAAVLLIAVAVWRIAPARPARADDELLTREIVSGHVRSLMADHLTDVASSDQHTVKPWFDGKLDFAPQVKDFAAQGYPLVGGRLEYLNNRAVAALVYQRQKHYINLFVWPAAGPGADAGGKALTRQGYNMFVWTSAGMTYWAVSDLNSAELQEFAALVRAQTPPAATGY